MKLLAVFPSAMHDGAAFGIAGFDFAAEFMLDGCTVGEEVRNAIPKPPTDARFVAI